MSNDTNRANRTRARKPAEGSVPLLTWGTEQKRRPTPPQIGLQSVGLFAGVGGIELGFERGGHQALLLCENDPGAKAVLGARFKDAKITDDVCKLRSLPKEATLLAAGFPCQDLSQAGKTRGISGEKSGLVGEVFRLLRRKRVPWVLIENVPFMLRLGRGHALEIIINELESMGYRWAYRVVNSSSFGLPQRRRRVFLLASMEYDPRDVLFADDAGRPIEEHTSVDLACGFYWTEGIRGLGWAVDGVPTLKGGSTIGIPSPPAIVMPDRTIIKPDIRDAERLQGFRENWTKPAEKAVRKSFRWRLIGNAVSVNAAAWIGKRLADPGLYDGTWDKELPRGATWPNAAWSNGDGRFSAGLSEWPVRRSRKPLHEFLKYPGDLLSIRATSGFRERTRVSSLRFPEGFLDAIDAHLDRMRKDQVDAAPKKRREGASLSA